MNYLLIGPEEYLRHQALERIKNQILKEQSEFNFESFRAGESEISTILNSMNTLPFFAKKRLIHIKDIEKFSAKDRAVFLKALKNAKDSSTVVMSSSSTQSGIFLENVGRFAKLVRCERLKSKETENWIRKEFLARGKKISSEVAETLRDEFGDDLFKLENEIEKIVLFANVDKEITKAHLEAVLGEGARKSAFSLVDLVIRKDGKKALLYANRLLPKEGPLQILNLIAWQFRNFLKIKEKKELGMSSGYMRRAKEQADRFTKRDLEKNLSLILEADFSIKCGRLKPDHALEQALARLCT